MGSMIDFKRPDGMNCRGYLAEAGKGKPGIVWAWERMMMFLGKNL